jgi:hypothetical protein
MPTVFDPNAVYVGYDRWSGTTGDDTLIYKQGNDSIDGLTGYDVLVVPFNQPDSIIGDYANNTISMSIPFRYYYSEFPDIGWTVMFVTATNIEQIQFNDKLLTLQERPPEPVAPVEQAPPQTQPTTASQPSTPGAISLADGLGDALIKAVYDPNSTVLAFNPEVIDTGTRLRVKTAKSVKKYQELVKKNKYHFIYGSYSGVLSYNPDPYSKGFSGMDQLVHFTNKPDRISPFVFQEDWSL